MLFRGCGCAGLSQDRVNASGVQDLGHYGLRDVCGVLIAISATRKLTLKSISSAPTSTNVGGLSP